MLAINIILVIALFSSIECYYSKSRKNPIQELSKDNCKNGYTGQNCTISTCIGYKLCKNETTCEIKNNIHQCVCKFLDNKENYRKIENCKGKYKIAHGDCYLGINGQKYCKCVKNWTGTNCESNILLKKKIHNLFQKSIYEDSGSPYKCDIPDKNGIKTKFNCTKIEEIWKGICYYITDKFFPICVCNKGFTGLFTCLTPTCENYDYCENNGTCKIENEKHSCKCASGYYGDTCNIKCPSICENGKYAIDLVNKVCICECNFGYIAPDCSDPLKFTTPKNSTESNTESTSKYTDIPSTKSSTQSISENKTETPIESTKLQITTKSTIELITQKSTTKSTYENTIIVPTTESTPPEITTHSIMDTTKESTRTQKKNETNTTEISKIISTISTTNIYRTRTATKTQITTQNSSSSTLNSENQIYLAYISIPVFIALAFVVIGVTSYYIQRRNRNLRKSDKATQFLASRL